MFDRLMAEIDSFRRRDPAARSRLEVLLCYPGFHAVLVYRMNHWLWENNYKLPARFFSMLTRWFTGVEIHPAATIGKRLFIDHGFGVVIGETAKIGDDVTLYQGVTLGGVSPHKNKPGDIRHPQLGNHVIVGSGAQLLGPVTVGDNARIGANAVVVHDVPPGATMVGVPAKDVAVRRMASEEFEAYGMDHGDLPDPLMRSFEAMQKEIRAMKEEIRELKAEEEELRDRSAGS